MQAGSVIERINGKAKCKRQKEEQHVWSFKRQQHNE